MLIRRLLHRRSLIKTYLFMLLLILFARDRHISERLFSLRSLDVDNNGAMANILNETLGFQKVLVVNLPSRTDNRDSMTLAASLTDLTAEYVDGVTLVNNRTLPPGGIETNLQPGSLGAWRAHMNALRMIVEQNIASALILEDDADWDVRIKSQMQDFARASRLLIQPLIDGKDEYLDPTFPQPSSRDAEYRDFNITHHDISEPSSSPYGDLDRWDLLWLGHCGSWFPLSKDMNVPLGRAVIANDETVPEQQHIDIELGSGALLTQYPSHTRVVSRAAVNTCSIAYAVSLSGAKRLLYELAIHKLTTATDLSLRSACEGSEGRPVHTCLTVQPQLFQCHRGVGSRSRFSDIMDYGDGYNDKAFSKNIRWSTRLNFAKLLRGQEDYVDLFKDGEERDEGIARQQVQLGS